MEKLIAQAAKILENGGVISLPTETVYSLSVNACDDVAVEKIYTLKGRKKNNPLALLVGNISMAKAMVTFDKNAAILAEAFFPGPISLILPKKPNTKISSLVNEDLETLAVRMPQHKITLAILNAVNFPVIGTSANPSSKAPAQDAKMVTEYFGNKLGMVIDGGKSNIGIASTIIDLTGNMPNIVRLGSVTKEQIEDRLKCEVKYVV